MDKHEYIAPKLRVIERQLESGVCLNGSTSSDTEKLEEEDYIW